MKAEMFEKIVEARANERAQAKMRVFIAVCTKAVVELTGEHSSGTNYGHGYGGKEYFAILASEKPYENWPKRLWEKERERVAEELLGVMDEMQRALIAAGRIPEGEQVIPSEE